MISERVKEVFRHRQWINGPEVADLEMRIANYVGRKHAVAVGSGYDALVLGMLAAGIKDWPYMVVTTPLTFGATVSAAMTASKVALVDIGDDLQIDHTQIKGAVDGSLLGAIMPVDLFGGTPNYQAMRETGFTIIEDAAQAFGAEYDGRMAGAFGDLGCFSFHPSKLLGACGDAGMIVLDDDEMMARIRVVANHGMHPWTKYVYAEPGINSRMDSIQAAILLDKLDSFDSVLSGRRTIAKIYRRELSCVKHPIQEGGIRRPSFSIYSVLFANMDQRNRAMSALNSAGFWARVYYPLPLHLQPAFQHLGYHRGDFPKAEKAAETILSLPMEISMDRIGQVIDIIRVVCEVK